jgi:translation initiation factor 1 (eIF-1/SUI1)
MGHLLRKADERRLMACVEAALGPGPAPPAGRWRSVQWRLAAPPQRADGEPPVAAGARLVVVYVFAPSGGGREAPVWLELPSDGARRLVPTVYACAMGAADGRMDAEWDVHAPVLDFLARGADLMLPGVVARRPMHFAEGALVLLRVAGAPVAVVETLKPSTDAEVAAGRGRVARVLNMIGDEVWNLGPRTLPERSWLPAPDPGDGGSEAKGDTEKDDESSPSDEDKVALDRVVDALKEEEEEEEEEEEKEEEEEEGSEIDEAEMDRLLWACLAAAIVRLDTAELPIAVDRLFSAHMKDRSAVRLDFRRSGFRQCARFFRAAEKAGWLTLKPKGGQLAVVSVNATHPEVAELKLQAPPPPRRAPAAGGGDIGAAAAPLHLDVTMLVDVPPALEFVFVAEELVALDRYAFSRKVSRALCTRAAARTAVLAYCGRSGLLPPDDPAHAHLDAALGAALFGRNPPNRVSKKDLAESVVRSFPAVARVRSAAFDEDVVAPIGRMRVRVSRTRRQGRKFVTMVAGLSRLGVPVDVAANHWRGRCAAGVSADASADTVSFQGDQVRLARALLAELGVPDELIDEVQQ